MPPLWRSELDARASWRKGEESAPVSSEKTVEKMSPGPQRVLGEYLASTFRNRGDDLATTSRRARASTYRVFLIQPRNLVFSWCCLLQRSRRLDDLLAFEPSAAAGGSRLHEAAKDRTQGRSAARGRPRERTSASLLRRCLAMSGDAATCDIDCQQYPHGGSSLALRGPD